MSARKLFAGLLVTGAIGSGVWLGSQRGSEVSVSFLDVGQGDCTVVQVGDTAILIDDGPNLHGYDAGKRVVIPKLRSLGVRDVSLILLTHPDMDHVGGTAALHRQFPDAKIAFNERFRGRAEVSGEQRTWGISDSQIWWLRERETMKLGPVSIEVQSPQVDRSAPTNDGSLFVRIRDGSGSIIVTGDAPMLQEILMSSRGDWSSDVIHAGHHGSRTSTSDRWLEATKPHFAVISCGRNNEYGHPHRATLERLSKLSISVLRTDQIGDIKFTLREGHFVPDRN